LQIHRCSTGARPASLRAVTLRKEHLPVLPLLKRATALFFLLLFLGIHAVAAEHTLHKKIHHDAGAAHHECVFVQFSSGHCLGVFAPVGLPVQHSFTAPAAPVVDFHFVSSACPILPGRAPPNSPA
jgi:hypothetical protein